MSSLSVSTQIAAPLQRTFEVFTDLEHAAERIPDIVSLELLTPGPVREGTRWRETRIMFKKEATEEMWITHFDPPNSYDVEAESCGVRYMTHFSFVPDGDATKVTWTFRGKPVKLMAKIMAPIMNVMMKGVMEKCMRRDLEALRDACERSS